MLATKSLLAVLPIVALFVACSSDSADGDRTRDGKDDDDDTRETPQSVSSRAEQVNDGCPSNPTQLSGTGAAGASCSTYADCRPSCCDCATSDASYLGAACIDGTCADKGDTCYQTKKETYCPGEPTPGSSSSGGGSSSSGGSSSGGPVVGGRTICVPGYASDCDDDGENWTGSECCVDDVTQCVAGYGSDCDDAGEHWTGNQCCVSNSPLCVAGYASDCDDAGEHWTGNQCCVEASICVAGYGSDCDDAGEHWTGNQCCVTDVTQCVDGYASDCDGAGEHWTGNKCCL